MFSLFQKPVIEFFCREDLYGVIPEPVPAYKNIPEWWKRLANTNDQRDHFGSKTFTAKKCMPLLDAMSYGYIIPLQADLHVITNSDRSILKTTDSPALKISEFHSLEQVGGKNAPGYPAKPLKFINHWCIKTAPGWSTLFIPPMNRVDSSTPTPTTRRSIFRLYGTHLTLTISSQLVLLSWLPYPLKGTRWIKSQS